MRFLIIDNYDSFVHNLARYFELAGVNTDIVRNDKIDLGTIQNYDAITLSPGPCKPDDAGACLDIVKTYGASMPIFGVCLGQQIIAQNYGAPVIKTAPIHGRASQITHDGSELFNAIPNTFEVGRYHSLINDFSNCDQLIITAQTHDNIPMAVQHKTHPVHAVQFHPESILTEHGLAIITNFVTIAQKFHQKDKAA